MLPHEPEFYRALLVGWMLLAAALVPVLLFITAPYGRFARRGWGPALPARVSWVLMESPTILVVAALFAVGRHKSLVHVVFLVLWNVHYVHRTLVYGLRVRSGRRMPVLLVASALFFNVVNGYLQGRYLFTLAPEAPAAWLAAPRFLAGLALFAGGLGVNTLADNALRRLRKPGESGYRIPRGGLFEWVSCPNYLGETVEWCGWALLTWSPAGLAFAAWTAANLVPRAIATHRWYRKEFSDYPPERRAILPFVL